MHQSTPAPSPAAAHAQVISVQPIVLAAPGRAFEYLRAAAHRRRQCAAVAAGVSGEPGRALTLPALHRPAHRCTRSTAGRHSPPPLCALALAEPDGALDVFEGEARGTIVWPPRGDKGFGYDPIFEPLGLDRTFGEMAHEEKLPLTHRARAFEKLVASLK